MRALWTVGRRRVCFFLALLIPSGAAVWLGAGGELGASNGMDTVACPAWDFFVPGIFRWGQGGSWLWLVGRGLLAGTVLGGLAPSPE